MGVRVKKRFNRGCTITDANGLKYVDIANKFMGWYLTDQGRRFHRSMIPQSFHAASYYIRDNGTRLDIGTTGNAARFAFGLSIYLFSKCGEFIEKDGTRGLDVKSELTSVSRPSLTATGTTIRSSGTGLNITETSGDLKFYLLDTNRVPDILPAVEMSVVEFRALTQRTSTTDNAAGNYVRGMDNADGYWLEIGRGSGNEVFAKVGHQTNTSSTFRLGVIHVSASYKTRLETLKTRLREISVSNVIGGPHARGFGQASRHTTPVPNWDFPVWNGSHGYNLGGIFVLYDDKIWVSVTGGSALRNRPPGPGNSAWEQVGTVWNATSTYNEGDLVYDDTRIWRAKQTNTGKRPSLKFNPDWEDSSIVFKFAGAAGGQLGSWQSDQQMFQLSTSRYLTPEIFSDLEKSDIARAILGEGSARGRGFTMNRNSSRNLFRVTIDAPPAGTDTRRARGTAFPGNRGFYIIDPGKGYDPNNRPKIHMDRGAWHDSGQQSHTLGVDENGGVFIPGIGGYSTGPIWDDSAGEELAWAVWCIELSAALHPTHEFRDAWLRGIINLQLNQKGRHIADVENENDPNSIANTVLDGKKLKEHLIPTNGIVNGRATENHRALCCADSYFFGNHGFAAHQTYNSGAHRSRLLGPLLLGMSGVPVPEAYGFNVREFFYAISRETQFWSPERRRVDGRTGLLNLTNTGSQRSGPFTTKTPGLVAVPGRMYQLEAEGSNTVAEVNWVTDNGDGNERGRAENYWTYAALCTLVRYLCGPLREHSNQLTIATSNANPAADAGVRAEPTEDAKIYLGTDIGDEPTGTPLILAWDDIRGLSNYNGTANISTLTAGTDYLTGTVGGKTVYILRKSPTYATWNSNTPYSLGTRVWYTSGGVRRLYVSRQNSNRGQTPTNNSHHTRQSGWSLATELCEVWALVVDSGGGTTRLIFDTENAEALESGFLESMAKTQTDTGVFAIRPEENGRPQGFETSTTTLGYQCNFLQNFGIGLLCSHVFSRRALPEVKRFDNSYSPRDT